MPKIRSNSNVNLSSPFRAQGEIDYKIEGRILRTTAIGPFDNELIAAIPSVISDLIANLVRQGKWGQIVTFQRNALGSPSAMADFEAYLKSRYKDQDTNPVTALVFGRDVIGGQLMSLQFQKCYEEAGIQSCVFQDYSAALHWVESKIRQTSILVAWSDNYRTGDAAIDDQHQELFMRAADVIAATTHESQTLSTMRLFQYTRTHFSHEESLMRRMNYPGLDEHVNEHDLLIAQLIEFSKNIAQDNMVKADLENFISNWFLTHVSTLDCQLAEFLKQ